MTYEMYRYIFVIAAVLCGVMFGVSVLLFFLLKWIYGEKKYPDD